MIRHLAPLRAGTSPLVSGRVFALPLVRALATWGPPTKPVELSYDLHEPDNVGRQGCMVICHGLLGSKLNWRTLARRFAKELEMPVFCLDMRNHGRSPHAEPHTYPAMATDVAHFLTEHKLDNVHLLGHSMGGKTVMALALNDHLNAPLQTLISADIAPTNNAIEPQYADYLKGFEEIEAANVGSKKEAHALLEKYEPVSFADGKGQRWSWVNDEVESTRRFLLTNAVAQDGNLKFRVNIPTLAGAVDGLGTFPYHISNGAPDAQYDGPTLFVRGSKSDYVRDEYVPDSRLFFPRLEIVTLDAGHWVHAERQKETGDAVINFVKRNSEA